jgi:hypothetical protein
MTLGQARKWLGLYFLLFTSALGTYLLIFAQSPLLPMKTADAGDAFKIIIPVLIGQIAVVFKWLAAGNRNNDGTCPIPPWAIKAPTLVTIGIVTASITLMIAGNYSTANWGISPDGFKNVVTFALSVLNASTLYLMPTLFPSTADGQPASPAPAGGISRDPGQTK